VILQPETTALLKNGAGVIVNELTLVAEWCCAVYYRYKNYFNPMPLSCGFVPPNQKLRAHIRRMLPLLFIPPLIQSTKKVGWLWNMNTASELGHHKRVASS
jgi:hypothetical protein